MRRLRGATWAEWRCLLVLALLLPAVLLPVPFGLVAGGLRRLDNWFYWEYPKGVNAIRARFDRVLRLKQADWHALSRRLDL